MRKETVEMTAAITVDIIHGYIHGNINSSISILLHLYITNIFRRVKEETFINVQIIHIF